ncbi:MAG: N-acetylmuramoyl-L-alanine amidase [Phaeodactylibacter sp.]|nr:N-acetylmuramoyl-L-alanine amidase [Phaeodactylibacter sp.]
MNIYARPTFRTLALLLFLAAQLSWIVDEPKYHKVPALPGDGVYSLLRRYGLEQYSCNHKMFYELNKLDKTTGLKVGRYYYVPILLYTFNGQTIRSSIGRDDWDLALKIQSYNEVMLSEGNRKKSFQENKILWVPHHLYHCPEPDITSGPVINNSSGEDAMVSSSGNRIFPIFGKGYEYVPLEGNKLRGQVFYVVSGHGGPDPGAMGSKSKHTLCEDEYAYDVALRLVRNLIAQGATAYMIVRDNNDGIRTGELLDCDYDEVVWGNLTIPRDQKLRLQQRAEIVNELYEKHKEQGVSKQQLIIIHVDSRSKGEQTDLFFYYHPASNGSKALALRLHQTMKRKYKKYRSSGQYSGTVTPRDLHMLRETKPPSVYIELGNIRNSFDQLRILPESNRQALANWLFEGLLE